MTSVSMQRFRQWIRPYLKWEMMSLLALGFASGLPLALTASTLSIWLVEAGVTKAAIGLFAAVATPYSLKFLWAPLIDSLPFPLLCRWFGRRRGWILGIQGLLAAAIILLGFADPNINPWTTALFAVGVATLSATQDILIDAFRVELLPVEEQGTGVAIFVLGYRFGMIASSAGALYLATQAGWLFTYIVMACLLAVGAFAVLFTREPGGSEAAEHANETARRNPMIWIREAAIGPFLDFMKKPHWLAILMFVFLYKFGDAFIGMMTNPFLLELGFTKLEIARVVKLYGLAAAIIGGFVGGAMVQRWGVMKPLWICGIAQGLTNLIFIIQARVGAETGMLAITIITENGVGGMATAAFVAYISSLCNLRFTATQYALLSSLASTARTVFSTPAGVAAESLGWEAFFLLSAFLTLPGLALLWYLQRRDVAKKNTPTP